MASYKVKPIKDWSEDEVQEWIKDLKGMNGTQKSKLMKAVNDSGLSGDILIEAESADDFVDFFDGVPKLLCKILYKKVEIKKNEKEESEDEIFARLVKHAQSNHKDTNKDKFTVNLQAQQGKMVTIPDCTPETTFGEVKRRYSDKECINYEAIGRLVCQSKIWADNKRLKEAGIAGSRNLVTVKFKQRGGAKPLSKEKRKRVIDINNKLIKSRVCMKPDDLTLDDSKMLRVKMDCGHVVGPHSMWMFMKTSLSDHFSIKEIVCPVPKCGKVWDWKLVTTVADLSPEEYAKYTAIIEGRSAEFHSKCPMCQAYIERPKDLTHFRVYHGKCDHYCYTCGGKWKTSGLTICGNKECPNQHVQDDLNKCGTAEIVYGDKKVTVPVFRACPKCLTFIDKDDGCKDVACIACKTHFCFGCLKLGNHACGGGWGACPGGIAPRQQL